MKKWAFRPRRLIIAGFSMIFLAWLVIFGMVLRIVPISFLLAFACYGIATAGLLVGFIGIFTSSRGDEAPGSYQADEDYNPYSGDDTEFK